MGWSLGNSSRAVGMVLDEAVTGIADGSLVLTNQKIKLERSLATNGSVGF